MKRLGLSLVTRWSFVREHQICRYVAARWSHPFCYSDQSQCPNYVWCGGCPCKWGKIPRMHIKCILGICGEWDFCTRSSCGPRSAVAARLNDDVGPCCCSGLSIMYEGAFSLVRPLWFVGNINFLLNPQKLQGRVWHNELIFLITSHTNLQVHLSLPNSKTSEGMLLRFAIDLFTIVVSLIQQLLGIQENVWGNIKAGLINHNGLELDCHGPHASNPEHWQRGRDGATLVL